MGNEGHHLVGMRKAFGRKSYTGDDILVYIVSFLTMHWPEELGYQPESRCSHVGLNWGNPSLRKGLPFGVFWTMKWNKKHLVALGYVFCKRWKWCQGSLPQGHGGTGV